jgi:inhibitor of KinA
LKDFKLTYHRFSERSILVQWPHKIDKIILEDVLLFKNHLLDYNIKPILQINNSYNSILVIYQFTIDNINDEFSSLKEQYFVRVSKKKSTTRLWKIPVCYDDKFGIDLDKMSREKHLSKTEIIKLHSEVIYTVFFIGFLPGFLYLGGLDKRLFFPRRQSPRLEVKKGAVAIGNEQTGIYPNSSPAGWNIIGNTPLSFFSAKDKNPCFAKAGDSVKFFSVALETYTDILNAVEHGTYRIENEILNG